MALESPVAQLTSPAEDACSCEHLRDDEREQRPSASESVHLEESIDANGGEPWHCFLNVDDIMAMSTVSCNVSRIAVDFYIGHCIKAASSEEQVSDSGSECGSVCFDFGEHREKFRVPYVCC